MTTRSRFLAALLSLFLFTASFASASAATRNNDDSCDIALLPAATLLLPWFEVDIDAPPGSANTTLFTVVNTSQRPQIARVTIWTDLAYPVMNFNLFLTGYDVQSVNLYDVIARGVLPGTTNHNSPGSRSLPNDANPNFRPGAAFSCSTAPPVPIPPSILGDIRTALTIGAISSCSGRVGSVHTSAQGYVTIDLVADCSLSIPTDPAYMSDLLYDNVLTGDYLWVNQSPITGNFAGGVPLVHIRAVPEGGLPGAVVPTNLPYTFYDRYTPSDARSMDRRQPLPNAFTTRFIQGGPGTLNTDLRIWREGVVAPTASCGSYSANLGPAMATTQNIRFDEHENPTTLAGFIFEPPLPLGPIILPPASSISTAVGGLPPLSTSGDLGGWLYLNLNNPGSTAYSKARPSQNWVVTSMSAEGRYQAAFDATMLANGCTPAPSVEQPIGPGPNTNAATFPSGSPSTTNNDDSCDIALLPAATLLLPLFEVDFIDPQSVARTTLFTVVNTSQVPQIARVTIWSDLGFPVLNFNLFLTGYDVQSINLYDVLARAVIAPPGGTSSSTDEGARSLPNNANPNFALTAVADCQINPGPVPPAIMNDIRGALTSGRISTCGTNQISTTHSDAIGFVTIDVVKTCGLSFPDTAAFYNDLLYDNVLTGDYQSINPNAATGNYAGGNPLVHIRAVPEGGAPGAPTPVTDLPYTFYDRYTPRATPKMDRRQPLPSAFAARFIQGGSGGFNTDFQIWREGVTGAGATCADYQKNTGSSMLVTDVVRFDEHENPTLLPGCPPILCSPFVLVLPETSVTASPSSNYPPLLGADVGGWMYLNLNNGGSTAYSKTRASQNWVTVSMFAEGRYSTAVDATALANGCSPAPAGGATIRPGPNAVP